MVSGFILGTFDSPIDVIGNQVLLAPVFKNDVKQMWEIHNNNNVQCKLGGGTIKRAKNGLKIHCREVGERPFTVLKGHLISSFKLLKHIGDVYMWYIWSQTWQSGAQFLPWNFPVVLCGIELGSDRLNIKTYWWCASLQDWLCEAKASQCATKMTPIRNVCNAPKPNETMQCFSLKSKELFELQHSRIFWLAAKQTMQQNQNSACLPAVLQI